MRNLTRRSILGGATALPFITAAPAFAALGVDRSAWNAILADYRAKYAAWLSAVDAEFAIEDVAVEKRRKRPYPAFARHPLPEQQPGEDTGAWALRVVPDVDARIAAEDAYKRRRDRAEKRFDQRHGVTAARKATAQASELREAAERRLIEAAAPDAAAWAERFTNLVADDYHEFCGVRDINATLLSDLQRITGTEARNG